MMHFHRDYGERLAGTGSGTGTGGGTGGDTGAWLSTGGKAMSRRHSHVTEQVGPSMTSLERLQNSTGHACMSICKRHALAAEMGKIHRPNAAPTPLAPPHNMTSFRSDLTNHVGMVGAVRLALAACINLVPRKVLHGREVWGEA